MAYSDIRLCDVRVRLSGVIIKAIYHLEELYEDAVRAKFDKIWSNPLHNCFRLLPHGIRLNVRQQTYNCLRDAFVAKAFQFYNN